ncbi:MAG: amino acid adenylation domain-containing protein [Candidatus Aminicenantes bacterium]|jgi:amino acid adenylation domain-containing protein
MKRIDQRDIEDILSLTPMQEGMLFYYLKEPGSDLYFEQLCVRISGEIDAVCFEQAWNFVINTNEMLRTVFRWEKMRKPAQLILKQYNLQVRYWDFSGQDAGGKKKRVNEIRTKDKQEKFDLRDVPFRVTLIKLADDRHEIIISNHHILYDGWSNGIILGEFFNVYNDLQQKKIPVKPTKGKFKEYLKWVQNQEQAKQEKYWREYLKGFDAPGELSVKQARVKEIGRPEHFEITFKGNTREQLEIFIHQNKLTMATIFYGAWGLLLQKYINSCDVIFGTTVSGRSAKIKGIEDIVGVFINTLPLRVKTYDKEKILNWLKRINEDLRRRETVESTPLVNIKGYSELKPNESLFDCLVVMENYPLDSRLKQQEKIGQLVINSYSNSEMTNYDLTVSITLSEDIRVNFVYQTEVLQKDTISRLALHFSNILTEISGRPAKDIDRVDMLSQPEKQQILYEFNDTLAEYSNNKSIHQSFEEQVARTPDNAALIFKDIELTYRELNRKANQLESILIEKGVTDGALVLLLMDRSIELILGILAVLKSGGIYLPVDIDYPENRLRYMIEDSHPQLVLTQSYLLGKIEFHGTVIAIDVIDMDTFKAVDTTPAVANNPKNPAYIIYTSGSAGKPKGVLVEHSSVVNLALSQKAQFGINERDRILQFSTICFDASVEQIFIALFSGAGLVLIDKGTLFHEGQFEALISSRSITHLHAVPSFLDNMRLKDTYNLKRIISGGDVCPVSLAKKWNKYCNFYNEYGPTETTVTSIEMSVEDVDESLPRLPIGRPINNTLVYLFDQWQKPVPLGVVGELYIGGEGVARGYLNCPELTAEKFVLAHSPWLIADRETMKPAVKFPMSDEPSAISYIYKTGDLARWFEQGNIEFLGRIDHQVKIRGFRIEPGEIETHLLKHKYVKQVIVINRKNKDKEKFLCAYIRLENHAGAFAKDFSIISELRQYLSQSLPDYMIPAHFVIIENIPLTPSGKVDRKALPEPEIISCREYAPPGNELEKKLAEIWGEVLGIEKGTIGIDDNFFKLGGHSLKAARLINQLNRIYDMEIPLAELFKSPTVLGLAEYINKNKKVKYGEINPVEEKEYYPLSSPQRGLFVIQQMDPDSTAYNMSGVMTLAGNVEKIRFEQIFKKLIYRHDSLRMSFEQVAEESVQRIEDEVEFEIDYYDWQATEASDRCRWEEASFGPINASGEGEAKPPTALTNSFIRPFDLSHAPLLRVGLKKIEDLKFLLMLDMHHIISDGTSVEILVNEFMSLCAGKELPALKLQYNDFSEWQDKQKKSELIKKQESYWLKEFCGEIPILNFPHDFLRPGVQDFDGDTLNFEMESQEITILKTLAQSENSTLFMVLFSLFNVLLARISGQEEVVVGTPLAGRIHADLEPIMGMFVNTLALRNYPTGDKAFYTFLQEVKGKTLSAFENQGYPFEELVKNLEINRDPGRNPLFDVMFAYQDLNIVQIEAEGLKLEPCNYKTGISKFDLTLLVREHHENLFFAFEYRTKLFKKATIERFIQYFKNIVSRVLIGPQEKISGLEIISDREKHRVLFDFNRTEVKYPEDKTFYHLFADQVEKSPDTAALVYEDQCITYCKSSETANRLALRLKQRNVKPGTIAAIMVRPAIGMITGLLGILKAGAAFLPIDPDYPGERIQYMLTDSNSKVLVTTGDLTKNVEKVGTYNLIFLESFEISDFYLSTQPALYPSPSSPAYVIYTSGSTGRPKGVLVDHQSLNNLCHWHNKRFSITANDRAFKYANFGFDASVWEIFPYLIMGASLYILNENIKPDISKLNEYFEINRISIGFLPTQICEQFMTVSNRSLRVLLTGGDQLKRFIKRNYQLVNNYGPTENTVVTTSFVVEDSYPNIPIGSPIDNTCIYILDKNNNVQPIGIPGELSVSGHGLARGYLNQPELTMERFCLRRPGGALFINILKKHAKKTSFWDDAPKERHQADREWAGGATPRKNFLLGAVKGVYMSYMSHKSCIYKTGDLARWLEDGNIEFLGRIDHQVKIRGFRIELGEIENHLLNHPRIKETVVLAKQDNNKDKYLCAYIVSKGQLPVPQLKKYLSASLPGYMIPSYFMMLDRMPLTPNGKINRKVLPEPVISTVEGVVAPRSPIEKKLAAIWQEVLNPGSNKIGIHDDFFALGGHSLKATLLISKIYKEFKVRVPLAAIFNTPTIKGVGEYIKSRRRETYVAPEPAENKEFYALSSAQKRLYILQQMDLESTVYNIPVFMIAEGEIKKAKFEAIFYQLIQRHESLRSSFMMIAEEPVQRIQVDVKFKVENQWTKGGAPLPVEPATALISSFIRPFDMSKAPLLRVGLTQIEKNKNFFMLDMHHIISDGMSVELLIKEFITLYTGQKLPSLKLRYRDYSQWQQQKLQREALKEQEVFWQQQLEGEITQLQLPIDFVRPKVPDFQGKQLNFEITQKETSGLKKLALKEGTTLYMLLLSIFNVFLSKITNQETIVIGTAVAGRRHADLEQIFGMFVNTLALINYPRSRIAFSEFLREVNRKTLDALENQDYPFEKLVEKAVLNRDINRNPLFDVMFALQPLGFNGINIPGLSLYPYDYKTNLAKFDLMLQAVEQHEILSFTIEYRTGLFRESTIRRFIRYIKKIIAVVPEQPAIKPGEIEFISGSEKNQILFEFNNTTSEYPKDELIHQLFEKEAEKRPQQTAVIYEGQSLTYCALNRESDRLAAYLPEKGVKLDSSVGIMLDASLEVIVGVLAILKAGAAYLPIDPGYPQVRTNYMLADSNANVLVTIGMLAKEGQKAREFQGNKNREIIFLDSFESSGFYPSTFQSFHLSQSSLAYVIYTSGSTGRPKGVMVEHRNVARLVKNTNFIDFKPEDRILQTGALEFDASTFEIWGALLNGLTLHLAPKEKLLNPGLLKKIIILNNITTIWLTAPLFNRMVQSGVDIFAGLGNLLVGGDVLSPPHINQIRRRFPRLNIINGYGPTENTTFSTTFLIEKEYTHNIPIGKPISNSTAYIVDKNNHLLPIGTAGELWVGGDGVSRGYLNNPELTAEKFDHDLWDYPHQKNKSFLGESRCFTGRFFKKAPLAAGGKLYKTGDWTRWLPDGNIEFLGRIDQQAKIRGFRIEPKEIEFCLLNQNYITEAVVQVRTDENGEKYLCAYLVSHHQLIPSELRENLSADLPDYMIPSYFVMLERIPLTSNGKVDWRVLPEPEKAPGHQYLAPRDEIEEKLVEIWKEVLGGSAAAEPTGISVDANFFELGGHSLKATLLIAKIHKIFDVNIPLTDIFTSPTIRELAGYIKAAALEKYISIEPAEVKEYYVLSSAQKRLYILQQMDLNNSSYNMPGVFIFEGKLNRKKIEKAFQRLIDRHEPLRTSFCWVDGEVVQKIDDQVEFRVSHKTISVNRTQEELRSRIKRFVKPFDLGKAPLLRVEIIELREEKHFVLFDMHHIISDGSSMEITVNDFVQLYENKHLDPLPVQYKDYAAWQNKQLSKDKLKKQEKYWLKKMDGFVFTQLPIDDFDSYNRVEGREERLKIDTTLYEKIETFCNKYNVTRFIFMIAVFEIVLAREIDQTDITIGIPVSLRKHSDLNHLIGIFLNVVLIRTIINDEDTFLTHLSKNKKTVIEDLSHQDYPYELLDSKIKESGHLKNSELFSILFNDFPGEVEQKISTRDFEIRPFEISEISPKYHMTVYVFDAYEYMTLNVVYKGNLYSDYSIKCLLEDFSSAIRLVVENEDITISELTLSGEDGYDEPGTELVSCDDIE